MMMSRKRNTSGFSLVELMVVIAIIGILVGLFLGPMAVSRLARLAISWGLIAGSWIMVGALLSGNFWWPTALKAMIPGGAILILTILGLTLAIIFRGFQGSREAAVETEDKDADHEAAEDERQPDLHSRCEKHQQNEDTQYAADDEVHLQTTRIRARRW